MKTDNIPTHAPNGLPYWLASVAVPGWGQLCQRRAIAFVWLAAVVGAYVWRGWAGLALHALCVWEGYVVSLRAPRAARGEA